MHFVPIWPSSGWWQLRDMKDCISRLRPWRRAAMSSCQATQRFACQAIVAQLSAVQTQINGLDKHITQAHRANADSKRLEAIPGFGVILSTAVVATMTDPKAFKTGREFAAWIGLVPRQNSSGGKERLGSISKQGDRYLRRLLVLGAISIVGSARTRPDKYPWVTELLGRRPAKVVAVALANKMAGTAWGDAGQGRDLSGLDTLKQHRHRSGSLKGLALGMRGYVEGIQERRG